VELLTERADETAEKKQTLSRILHTAPMDNPKGSLQKLFRFSEVRTRVDFS